jgi:hypothetical protein
LFKSTKVFRRPFEGSSFERESGFGEVDLDAVRSAFEAAPNVGLGFADEILQEALRRIPGDPGLRVEQAQRRRRDDGLLHRPVSMRLGLPQVVRRVGLVAERPGREDGELAGVAVLERDGNAFWGEGGRAHRTSGITDLAEGVVRYASE